MMYYEIGWKYSISKCYKLLHPLMFLLYLVSILLLCFCEFFDSVDAVFVKITMYLNFVILENKSQTESKTSKQKRRTFWYFLVIKSTGTYFIYTERIERTHWTNGSVLSSEYSTCFQVRCFFTIPALCIFARYWEICDGAQFVRRAISPEGSEGVRKRR